MLQCFVNATAVVLHASLARYLFSLMLWYTAFFGIICDALRARLDQELLKSEEQTENEA